MDNPTTAIQPASQARDQLRQAAEILQHLADAANPQQQLLAERDHYARMWDEVMQEVLKNLQGIRDDHTHLRHDLRDASENGAKESIEILAQIKALRAELKCLQNTFEAAYRLDHPYYPNPAPPEPAATKAQWWEFWR